MIKLRDGVHLQLEKTYVFDAKRLSPDNINLISHGHYDHLPSSFGTRKVVCSKITKKVIKARKKKDVIRLRRWNIKLLDAGHVLGSNMFLIDKRVLYTGDFNIEKKYCGAAKPRKCETLIIDSTYGKPKYVFPKYKEVTSQIKDFIEDMLKKDKQMMFFAYSFGKSQELCHLLEKWGFAFTVNKRIAELNENLGLKYKNYKMESPILITNPSKIQGAREYVRVAFSGWAFEPYYNNILKVDKSFILSNHADFPSLMEFAEKCRPDKIYTTHGFNADLSHELRKRGFDAEPLLGKQKLLTHFA